MKTQRRAFTLVELMAVAANVAILVGVLVPAALTLRNTFARAAGPDHSAAHTPAVAAPGPHADPTETADAGNTSGLWAR